MHSNSTPTRRGGRPRVGSAFKHKAADGSEHWDIRITLPDGKRSAPICLLGYSEARAREKAKALTELAAREALPSPAVVKAAEGDTFTEWCSKWCEHREERGLVSVDDDRGRLRKWVFPMLGARPMSSITKRDLERLVEHLDEQARADALSCKTAGNVWATVSKAFDDATNAKTLALRVLEANPAVGVRGPDDGPKRAKAYLYPSELLALVSCERMPLRWRRLFAVGAYTYLRAGELEALEWSDVDLARRVIHVHRAVDRSKDGETKTTKTNAPRTIPIEPELVPLLEVMKRGATSARVIVMPPAGDIPARLRKYLAWAGVDRAALFANDKTRKQIGFHDAGRATGITWMALRGDAPLVIKQRAGHSSFSTTEGYIREAETLAHLRGEDVARPFPPLPASLLVSSEESSEGPAHWAQLRASVWESLASPAGFEPA